MHAVPYLTVPAAGTAAPSGPTSLAMNLAAHPERWRPPVDYRADTRWYRLLERTERHEVWLLSWLPGQGTDLHDHGSASGTVPAVSVHVYPPGLVVPNPSHEQFVNWSGPPVRC